MIIRVIQQEYPNQMQHMMTGPADRPTPREAHPAFYGCFDWHSSVEMQWVLNPPLHFIECRMLPAFWQGFDFRKILPTDGLE